MTLLAGMIIRPRATSERTSAGSSFSRRATYSISCETTPWCAISICVIVSFPFQDRPHVLPNQTSSSRIQGFQTAIVDRYPLSGNSGGES